MSPLKKSLPGISALKKQQRTSKLHFSHWDAKLQAPIGARVNIISTTKST